MIRMKTSVRSLVDDAIRAGERATDAVIKDAGHLMRYKARDLTRGNPKKVRPAGKPWRRGTGLLRDMIRFDPDYGRREVWLGFRAGQKVGDLHEFGGTVRKPGRMLEYPERPVIQPAREKAIESGRDKWGDMWGKVFGK